MKEKRGSILDLFLIFLLLLCLVGGLLRWRDLRTRGDSVATSPYLVTAVAHQVDPQVADCISVGELLYTESGMYFGRVTAMESSPTRVSLLSDGAYTEGSWDADWFVDLWLEVEIEATDGKQGILHNGRTPYALSERITLYSERTALSVKLYQIIPFTS